MNSTFSIPPRLTKFILWGIWFAITAGLVMMVLLIWPASPGENASLSLTVLPLIPLLISGIIRWVAFPKADTLAKAVPLFMIGVAMTEGGGILGILLGYPIYVIPALIGLFQFAPFWADKLNSEPLPHPPLNKDPDMKIRYVPRWKELFDGYYGDHQFTVERTIGIPHVYFPTEEKWKATAPPWAQTLWKEAKEEAERWCSVNSNLFSVDPTAWLDFPESNQKES